jgi:hypothetical protein
MNASVINLEAFYVAPINPRLKDVRDVSRFCITFVIITLREE